jgi:histone H3/H4
MVKKQSSKKYSKGLSKAQIKKAIKLGLKTDSITKKQHRISGDAILVFKSLAEDFVKALTKMAYMKATSQRRKGLRLIDIEEAVLELKYPFSMKASVPALRTAGNSFYKTHGLASNPIRRLMKDSTPEVAQISPQAIPRVAMAILSFVSELAQACDSINSLYNRKTVKSNLVKMVLGIAKASVTA